MLSVKVGEVLLVLGALHLTNFAIFRRIRRRPAPAAPGPELGAAQDGQRLLRGLPPAPAPRDPQDVH